MFNMRTIRIQGYEFYLENGFVQVWTDGSCLNNGGDNRQAGIGVFWGIDHPLNVSDAVFGPATNNRGELQAAIQAIKDARGMGIWRLCINTDSHYLKDGAEEWRFTWRQNGWRLPNGMPVKNKDNWRQLDQLLDEYQVDMPTIFNYVEAHAGNPGNEGADYLAVRGARNYPLFMEN